LDVLGIAAAVTIEVACTVFAIGSFFKQMSLCFTERQVLQPFPLFLDGFVPERLIRRDVPAVLPVFVSEPVDIQLQTSDSIYAASRASTVG
jgi:hypothetical protein